MTFKKIIGVSILILSAYFSIAQPTHVYTDIEKQFKSAEDLIQNKQLKFIIYTVTYIYKYNNSSGDII